MHFYISFLLQNKYVPQGTLLSEERPRKMQLRQGSTQFFAYNTKLQIMEMLASNDFTAAQKAAKRLPQPADH